MVPAAGDCCFADTMAATQLLLIYRNVPQQKSTGCAIGLGVNALHTLRVLRRAGVEVDATSAAESADAHAALLARPNVTHW
jgi:hypothetical protein